MLKMDGWPDPGQEALRPRVSGSHILTAESGDTSVSLYVQHAESDSCIRVWSVSAGSDETGLKSRAGFDEACQCWSPLLCDREYSECASAWDGIAMCFRRCCHELIMSPMSSTKDDDVGVQ